MAGATEGRQHRRRAKTKHEPSPQQQTPVIPGVFSELQHLLCTVLNIPKESSAGVLEEEKKKNRSSTQLQQQMKITYCVFLQPKHLKTLRSSSHLHKSNYFPAFKLRSEEGIKGCGRSCLRTRLRKWIINSFLIRLCLISLPCLDSVKGFIVSKTLHHGLNGMTEPVHIQEHHAVL